MMKLAPVTNTSIRNILARVMSISYVMKVKWPSSLLRSGGPSNLAIVVVVVFKYLMFDFFNTNFDHSSYLKYFKNTLRNKLYYS
jgi:hypothetical protein